jgi:hypothetical protein
MKSITTFGEWRQSLGRVIFQLSVVLVSISLVDLFVNRLLFRAGPEVISQLNFDSTSLAVIGRISLTVEQFILFVVIGLTVMLMFQEGTRSLRLLSIGLASIAVCSGLLYGSLPGQMGWAVSVLLIVATLATISGLAYRRISTREWESRRERRVLQGFLILVVASFFFPLYYRAYSLAGPLGSASLPWGFQSYEVGLFSVMATAVVALAYSLSVPSPGFNLGLRNVGKAVVLPTLIVVPTLYGLISSFFATQIFTLVVVTTTDFALSHDLVQTLVAVSWFLLTAVIILFLKGRHSTNKTLIQEGIGLLLIMSTTFLFNYPYYLMLGVVGVLFLCHPLVRVDLEQKS